MNYLKRAKIKSTTLRLHNRINNKVFVTKTSLYCNTCGKSIQENPILCYMFIEFFCTEKCHVQKHKIYLEKPEPCIFPLKVGYGLPDY
jgi:hypothetical protein